MPVDATLDEKLERAYVESKVIKTGLDRLATRMDAAVDETLRRDLHECSERFDAYMRDLREARTREGELALRK
jgi:hypothetical protein